MKGYIYTLKSPIDGRIRYVGKTKRPKARKREHCYKCYLKRRNRKNNWVKSLLKRGVKPIFEILDYVNYDEIDFYEEYWISQFKCWGFDLVNSTNGGVGLINPSEDIRKKIGDKSRGRTLSLESRKKISEANYNSDYTSKGILSMDKSGNRKYFKNARRASESLNVPYKAISKICYGGVFYKGYTFFFSDEENIIFKFNDRLKRSIRKGEEFLMVDFNGVIIKKYCNIIQASEDIGCNYRNIHECLKGNRRSCGGFFWFYIDEYSDKKVNSIKEVKTNSKSVYKIDIKTGKILKKFKSVKEASIDGGVSPSSISNNCKGKTMTCKGYKYKYQNEI